MKIEHIMDLLIGMRKEGKLFSLDDAARDTGLSRQTVYNFERERGSNPNARLMLYYLRKVCYTLDNNPGKLGMDAATAWKYERYLINLIIKEG